MSTVLITGGFSNLGKAIADEFKKHGYEVLLTTTKSEKATAKNILNVDLTNSKEIKEKLSKIEKLDVLVNNAGIFTSALQQDLTEESFDSVFNLNMKGLFLTVQALLPALSKANGSIVNISSMNAKHPGFGGTAHYDASKGAVSAYTASLAVETGLRVNAVAPGLIKADRLLNTPLEKHYKDHSVKNDMVEPEVIAKAVYFLATSEGIYGQTLLVDNGYLLK